MNGQQQKQQDSGARDQEIRAALDQPENRNRVASQKISPRTVELRMQRDCAKFTRARISPRRIPAGGPCRVRWINLD